MTKWSAMYRQTLTLFTRIRRIPSKRDPTNVRQGIRRTEGLGEALMMFPVNASQNQHNIGVQRHCVLVAASEPTIDIVKNPHYLVLISETFMEARAALSRSGITTLPSQSPIKVDHSVPPVSGPPPTSVPPVNGSMMNRQPVPVGSVPPATVKVEPTTVPSMPPAPVPVPAPSFQHVPPVARPTSQGIPTMQTSSPLSVSQDMLSNNDTVMQDMKPNVTGMQQPARPAGPVNVSILNNLSQARLMNNGTSMGIPSIGGNPMSMHMSNMISSGMASTVPVSQTVISSVQPGIPPISGTVQSTVPVPGSFTSTTSNMSGSPSQPLGNLQGSVGMGQPISGISQGSLPGAGPQMVQSGMGMNQNMMGGVGQGQSGMTGVGTGTGTGSGPGMMPTPGIGQQVPGMQTLGVNNNTAANVGLPQQTSGGGALQSAQSKYVKVWEGNLSGQRQGQPVFITRLEGYRSASASESLAANWPPTMQIVRLISQDHMNNKQYVGKADFLVFRAMNQHGFLGQLQEKKLCAVIQLPSQTLLLSVSDKACRLIGMLFPGQPQMVGTGMNQGYVQGPGGRTQMVPQGQVSSQGPQSMSGGSFIN
nr:hypothetical protein [Tanacetum cinerariifolium]